LPIEEVAIYPHPFVNSMIQPKRKLPLTPRERQSVEAMMTAASNQAIAARLGITEQSVKNRLTALYRKLGVSNRLELVVKLTNEEA
jgi:two-component system nitrate/nitrite response regulator NarL